MRKRITLQRNTPTTTARGQKVDVYSTLAIVWAEVVPVSVAEMATNGAVLQDTVLTVRIRHRGDLTQIDRLLYDGGAYELVGDPINEGGRNASLLIKARKIA